MTPSWGYVFLGYLGKPHRDTDLIWATCYPPTPSAQLTQDFPWVCVDGQLCQLCVCVCVAGWSVFDCMKGGREGRVGGLGTGGGSPSENTDPTRSCVPDTPRFPLSRRTEKQTIRAPGACVWYHHIDCSDGTGFCRGWDDVTKHQRPPLATSTFLKVGFECEFYRKKSSERSSMYTRVLLKCESLFPCQLPATVKYTPWSSRLIRVQKEILQACHPVLLLEVDMNL